jgi:hypothetical protein
MTQVQVECLMCGCQRVVDDTERALGTGACLRCGYVGWAYSSELNEDARRALREAPVASRPVENPRSRLAA